MSQIKLRSLILIWSAESGWVMHKLYINYT